VSLYLGMIITVTSLGQNKLRESQHRELELKVKSYAGTLNNLFTIASEDIDNLSTDKTVQTFFANLASGMSMEYGLGASLVNLERKLNKKTAAKAINGLPIYTQLKLVGLDGKVIVASGPDFNRNVYSVHLLDNHQCADNIVATRDNGKI
ncbi:GGDEF-domain containing protein, partial [Vibrio astriarenae]